VINSRILVCARCKEEFDDPWYGDTFVNAKGEVWLTLCNDCINKLSEEFE
jgi:hypothetical protein